LFVSPINPRFLGMKRKVSPDPKYARSRLKGPVLENFRARWARPSRRSRADCYGATRTGDGERALVTVQILELGLGGKFQAKSSGWDENRTFLEGDVLVVAVRNGRWVLTHLTHGPRPAAPAPEHYFPTEE